MYSIKVECEDKVSICRGCLSIDRRVESLTDDLDLFFSLLGAQKELCVSYLCDKHIHFVIFCTAYTYNHGHK
jgi:hypothetical protein